MSVKREIVDYISYRKLFLLLDDLGRKPIYLYNVVSPPTLAKLRQNKSVSLDVILRLCVHFNVQPGDIMEVRRKVRFVEVVASE